MQPQIEPSNPWLDQRGTWNCWVLGRLRDGVSREQAQSALQALATQISKVNNRLNTFRIQLQPPGFAGSWLRPYLLAIGGTLFAATALVLLAACLNIASLLLARGSDRSKEVAVRLALGASRSQISRQLLTESLVLAVIGGTLGFVFAAVMMGALEKFPLPTDVPVTTELALDYRVLAFAVLTSVLTSLVFGAVPAFRSSGVHVVSGLTQESRFRLRRFELRDVLVTVQIAVSILLLSGSALVFRSMREALHLNFGFNPRGVVSVSLDLALQGYDDARGRQFQIDALRRIQDLPGVQSAGMINSLPLTTDQSSTCINVEGRPESSQHCVYYYHAASAYFQTMQTRIVTGREFEPSYIPG